MSRISVGLAVYNGSDNLATAIVATGGSIP